MKRRPFFLMEVLIGVVLVGLFAVVSIRGAFKVVHKQRALIKEMEGAMEADRLRMEVIRECWGMVEQMDDKFRKINDRFMVRSRQGENGAYLLQIKDQQSKEKYSYLVTR